MQQEAERMLTVDSSVMPDAAPHGPSADFIYAISEFLDTDPKDLLVELGYYGENCTPASATRPLTQ